MTDAEKLRREVKRVGKQVRNRVSGFRSQVLGPWWKRVRDQKLTVRDGRAPLGSDIVLYLIYQPNGICRSTWSTLNHLASRGLTIYAVCNGSLPAEDEIRLRDLAWRVVSRPNLGYDFGGYQDGIWWLKSNDIQFDRLVVLNDTVWWPALAGSGRRGSLDQFLALDGDYTALCDFFYHPKRGRNKALVDEVYASSFCFAVRPAVWNSSAFETYWDTLPIQGDKARVVELGEVGFSRAMATAGFVPTPLITVREVNATALNLSADAQKNFVDRLPVLRRAWAASVEQIARTETVDPSKAQVDRAAFLAEVIPQLNPWDSLAVNGLVSGQIDFIKKANIKNPETARRFLAMADAADVDLRPEVRDEIVALAWATS